MFAPYCPQHESRVLLFADSIVALEQTDTGLRLWFKCTCGHEGVHDFDQSHTLNAA